MNHDRAKCIEAALSLSKYVGLTLLRVEVQAKLDEQILAGRGARKHRANKAMDQNRQHT